MRRLSLISLGSASIGVIFLYLLGIFIRGHYGIAVSVHNVSGQPLRQIRLNVEPWGKQYDLRALPDQQRARVFVQPRTESHVALQYTDANGPHNQTVIGYVESGSCGKADITILPGGKLSTSESIDPVFCKRSWLDFMQE